MIEWETIDELPDALKDGRPVLLWVVDEAVTARWRGGGWALVQAGSYAEDDDVNGEISHFAEIDAPEVGKSVFGIPVVSAPQFFGMGLVRDGGLPVDVVEIRDQRTGELLARIEGIGPKPD